MNQEPFVIGSRTRLLEVLQFITNPKSKSNYPYSIIYLSENVKNAKINILN